MRKNVPQLLERIADLERAVAVLAFAAHGDLDFHRVQITYLERGTRFEIELTDKTVIVETKS